MAASLFSSSTPIDLSRLPAPIFVEQKTYDQLYAERLADHIARCQAAGIAFDATVKSDPAIKLIEDAAYRELLLRQAFQDGCAQLLVAFAKGPILDHLGALVGVERLIVTPADPDTGADAVLELDDDFRKRIVLAPESFSVAGPELAYVFWAKSASADVADASFTSPTPGQAVITILSVDGDGTAPADLLDAVRAVVGADGIRPQTDEVIVQSADIVDFTIAARVYTYAGPDYAIVLAAGRTKLDAYLATSRQLGRSITLSGIEAALTVEGVQRVELDAPVAHVTCDLTQAANCTDIQIAHGGYAS